MRYLNGESQAPRKLADLPRLHPLAVFFIDELIQLAYFDAVPARFGQLSSGLVRGEREWVRLVENLEDDGPEYLAIGFCTLSFLESFRLRPQVS